MLVHIYSINICVCVFIYASIWKHERIFINQGIVPQGFALTCGSSWRGVQSALLWILFLYSFGPRPRLKHRVIFEYINTCIELCMKAFLKSFPKYTVWDFVTNPVNSLPNPSLSSVLETIVMQSMCVLAVVYKMLRATHWRRCSCCHPWQYQDR